jgi:hypothetical protein
MPAVTVRTHQRLPVPGVVRTQHGPSGGCGPCAVEPVLRYHCDRTDALARPWRAGGVRDGFVHTYRDETATGRCGVSAPQWGEPGYKPPGFLPRPQASRGHKRAFWGTLALGLVGQAVYLWAIGGNSDTNNNGCIDGSEAVFAHPWLALAGFLVAVAALVLAVVVMRRSRHPPQGFPRFGIVIAPLPPSTSAGWRSCRSGAPAGSRRRITALGGWPPSVRHVPSAGRAEVRCSSGTRLATGLTQRERNAPYGQASS